MTIWQRWEAYKRQVALENERKHLKNLKWELAHVNDRIATMEEHRRSILQDIVRAEISFKAAQKRNTEECHEPNA